MWYPVDVASSAAIQYPAAGYFNGRYGVDFSFSGTFIFFLSLILTPFGIGLLTSGQLYNGSKFSILFLGVRFFFGSSERDGGTWVVSEDTYVVAGIQLSGTATMDLRNVATLIRGGVSLYSTREMPPTYGIPQVAVVFLFGPIIVARGDTGRLSPASGFVTTRQSRIAVNWPPALISIFSVSGGGILELPAELDRIFFATSTSDASLRFAAAVAGVPAPAQIDAPARTVISHIIIEVS